MKNIDWLILGNIILKVVYTILTILFFGTVFALCVTYLSATSFMVLTVIGLICLYIYIEYGMQVRNKRIK